MEIIQEKKNYELSSHVWNYNDIVEFAHWHEIIEIVQVLNDKCRFLIDGNSIEAEKGDLVVLREGSIHLHFRENDNCEYRLVHFPYRLFLDTKRHPGNVKTHIKGEEITEIPDLAGNLNTLFEMMDKQDKATKAEENSFFAYLIMAVYSELAKHFPEEESAKASKSEKKEIYRIIEYINSHFKEDINNQTVSDVLFISRSRLAGLFKKYMHMSMKEYVTRTRLDNANQMILDGESVTDAAFESGFQSIRTFNNAYKEYMQMTPSDYIRNHIKKKS